MVPLIVHIAVSLWLQAKYQISGMIFALGQSPIALIYDKGTPRFYGIFDVGCSSELQIFISSLVVMMAYLHDFMQIRSAIHTYC